MHGLEALFVPAGLDVNRNGRMLALPSYATVLFFTLQFSPSHRWDQTFTANPRASARQLAAIARNSGFQISRRQFFRVFRSPREGVGGWYVGPTPAELLEARERRELEDYSSSAFVDQDALLCAFLLVAVDQELDTKSLALDLDELDTLDLGELETPSFLRKLLTVRAESSRTSQPSRAPLEDSVRPKFMDDGDWRLAVAWASGKTSFVS